MAVWPPGLEVLVLSVLAASSLFLNECDIFEVQLDTAIITCTWTCFFNLMICTCHVWVHMFTIRGP